MLTWAQRCSLGEFAPSNWFGLIRITVTPHIPWQLGLNSLRLRFSTNRALGARFCDSDTIIAPLAGAIVELLFGLGQDTEGSELFRQTGIPLPFTCHGRLARIQYQYGSVTRVRLEGSVMDPWTWSSRPLVTSSDCHPLDRGIGVARIVR